MAEEVAVQQDKYQGMPSAVRAQAEKAESIPRGGGEQEGRPTEAPVQQPPAVPTQQPIESQPQNDNWQHKYQVIAGKYNAETAAMRTQIQDLQNTVRGVASENERLREALKGNNGTGEKPVQPKAATPQEQAPKPGDLESLNPDDFEGWGDEMIRMVELNNRLIKRIESLEGQTKTVIQQSERVQKDLVAEKDAKFWRDLTMLVPNWKQINGDPENGNSGADERWIPWLQDLGGLHQRELRAAQQAMDAARVADVFKGFLAHVGGKAPVPTQEQQVVPQQTRPAQFFEPPEAGVSVRVVDDGNRPVVHPSDFKRASEDRVAGRITEDEYQRITSQLQADIHARRVQSFLPCHDVKVG